ncbi:MULTISPECIES: hypothetical protein [Metabacillus]|uniref:hypothetical protein n=1 Tax=Metabacillus TaxID=2675233 RepID=UPI000C80BD32|nr:MULTISPECIES: hypothetical protein [Metabacillus]MCM3443610.1 hypothetical protein [Metabacillus halosaccharovorans]PMC34231.1 hypothetical protein CJ195_24240 [Bacillus sp. UMB0899]
MAKKLMTIMAIISIVYVSSIALFPEFASAATDATDAWKKAGISPDGDFEDSGVYDDMSMLVYFLMAVGAIWIVACLVWGGMTLAGSGGNPQKRTEGFIKLALVFVGGWIIMKAYDIAGWIAGFGA